MLSHCANSRCSKPFLRLGEGKLFVVEAEGTARSGEPTVPFSPYARRPPRRVERYWLCDQCAHSSTLVYERQQGIALVPLPMALRSTSVAVEGSAEMPGAVPLPERGVVASACLHAISREDGVA